MVTCSCCKSWANQEIYIPWKGPYTVLDKINDSNYRIQLIGPPSKDLVVHHNRLKLCYGAPHDTPTSPSNNCTTTRLYSDVVRQSSNQGGGYTSSVSSPQPASTTPTTPALAAPAPRPSRNHGPPVCYNDFVRSDNL